MKFLLKKILDLFDPKQQWRLIGLGLLMIGVLLLVYGGYSLLWIGCGDPFFLTLLVSWLLTGIVCTVGGFLVTFGEDFSNPTNSASTDSSGQTSS